MIILTYLIFSLLVFRFSIVLFNYLSYPRLLAASRRYFDFISILIPAGRNPESLRTLLSSVQEQDFENYEVIIYDAGEHAETLRIASAFEKTDERFKVLKGEPAPAGWQRKNHACHQLALRADGDYFLFLEAGVRLEKGLLWHLLYRMKLHNLSLFSLFPDYKMDTWSERLLTPLLHYFMLSMFPLRLVLLSKNKVFSAASGRFMLFNGENYRIFQWHEKLKEHEKEAVAIMRMMKGCGLRVESLLANGMASCRSNEHYTAGIDNIGKHLLTAFQSRELGVLGTAGMLIYVLLVVIGFVVVVPFLNIQLITIAVMLMLGMRIMISLMSHQPVLQNVLLHPLQMFSLTVAIVTAAAGRAGKL